MSRSRTSFSADSLTCTTSTASTSPAVGTALANRQLDTKNQSFTLSSLQLNVTKKTSAENPFGFTLQLVGGKATDILHTAEPGGAETYKNFQQAYVTYAAKDGTTVDFGKFLTWIGYEGVQPVANDLYSIGFLFYFCQPTYHNGLRVSKSLPAGLNASLYLVNGWNEAEDSNANKSYGGTLSKTFGSTTVTANYYGGVEGSSNTNGFFGVSAPGAGAGKSALNLGDLIVVSQITPKLKLALNGDYGNLKGVNAGLSGTFRGLAGTAKYAINDKLYGTVRYESVSDPDGVRVVGVDGRYNSITAGLEYNLTPASMFRLEYRSDNSNYNAFEGENGAMKRTRDTITFAHVLRF